MADYKQMYHILFNSITDTISILQATQRRCEEMYMAGDPPLVEIATTLVWHPKTSDEEDLPET